MMAEVRQTQSSDSQDLSLSTVFFSTGDGIERSIYLCHLCNFLLHSIGFIYVYIYNTPL